MNHRITLAVLTLIACGPVAHTITSPVPPASNGEVTFDGGTFDGGTTAAHRACSTLRALGCEEGTTDPRTEKTCEEAWDSYATITALPVDCIATAKTKPEVRACAPGFLACP